MGNVAIEVENISKRYRIGLAEDQHDTMFQAVMAAFARPLRNFRDLRKLSRFKQEEAADILWALRDISFQVNRGEVVGVIGRNGAGKSTLLKVLSRITEPTYGKASIQGRVSSLLEVGTGFHKELTGRENVYLNGTVLGMRKEEVDRKFDEIVAFSGVEKFIDTPVKRYSSGMSVRLAFSVAAHLEPEVLLIDEVLAVGDLAFQKKCLGKMEEVAEGGRTVLFVSHNMQMIDTLCPRTILLKDGKVLCDGKTTDVLEQYYASLEDLKVDAETALNNMRHRRGLGHARFTRIVVRDAEGHERYRFHQGEPVFFELSYEVFEDLKGLDVGILFRSGKSREPLAELRHCVTKGNLSVGHQNTIQVEVPALPLRPGTYPLYFGLARNRADDTREQHRYEERRPYDIVDDLTAPLIVEAETDERRPGYFDVTSRLHVQNLVEAVSSP